MAHSLGALLLPAPPADSSSDSVGDPALDILGDFFKAVIEHHLADVWSDCAPNEPIVRKLERHDPEEWDFSVKDTPVLCVWREADANPNQLADCYQETQSQIRILWVLPPTDRFKNAKRSAFFSAFDKAINLAVFHERDRSYVHPSQSASSDASAAVKAEAAAYGSDIFPLAGIDWWRLQGAVQRVPVDINGGGAQPFRFNGYLATLLIGESSVTDPTAFGTEPTAMHMHITTGGADPLVTQTALVPVPEPEPEPEPDEDP